MCFGWVCLDHVVTMPADDEILGSVAANDSAPMRSRENLVYVDGADLAVVIPPGLTDSMFVEESSDESAPFDVHPGGLC